MKKLLCLILSSIICTAGITAAGAENNTAYFAYTFTSGSDTSDNIYSPYNISKADIDGLGVKAVAKSAKTHLDSMPEGRRCVNILQISRFLIQDSEDSIFWDKGAEYVKEIITALFKEMKAIDAPLDYVIDDMENGMSNWVLKDSEKVHAIERNPRYTEEVRPLLEERGYTFGTAEQGELYYLWNWSKHKTAYLIWNNVMSCRIADYYNYAVYNPIDEIYPGIKLSNYSDVDYNGEALKCDVAGHKEHLGGITKRVGTHSSPVLYGNMGQITRNLPTGYKFEEFSLTGFNCLLKEAMHTQSAVYSGDGAGIMPWIGLKTWTKSAAYRNFFNTHYYDENVFHLGLMGSDPFLLFDVGGDDETADREYLSKLMHELDSVTGAQKGEIIKTPVIDWNDRFVITGANLSDKSLWRITPDLYTKGVSIESFKVSDAPITFAISNKKIIFPEGSTIIGNNLSNYGYWVSAPKNANVQIVTDKTLTEAGAPVKTDDYIPTGYMYETDVTKIENKPAEETKQEEIEEPKEPEKQEESSEISGHWAEKQLKKAVSAGVMQGTDKGLEPDKVLTKAELITMLCRGTGVGMSDYAGYFDDISGSEWYAPYAGSAVKYQWISAGGSFNPNEPVSRAETSLIMARVLGVGGGSTTLTDIGSYSTEVQQAISGLSERGIITGYPDGTFKGENSLTRAEAAVILCRSIL